MGGLTFKIQMSEEEVEKVLLRHAIDRGLVGAKEAECFREISKQPGRYLLEFIVPVQSKEKVGEEEK